MRPLHTAAVASCFVLLAACADSAPPSPAADAGQGDAAALADSAAPVDSASQAQADAKPTDATADVAADAAAFVPLSLAPTELQALIPERDFLLINLVVPSKSLIDGTDLSVASTDTVGLENALQHDKNRKVVFYCMSGKTSKIVMAKLAGLGYGQMRDLSGGLMAWQAAGLPTKKP